MEILKYSQWAHTQHTIHMVMQMIGKVKLEMMPPQPEWGQILLFPTAQGFTTGLIPNGEKSFDISMNLGTSMVYAHCSDGTVAGFPLRNNTSVSEYYADFQHMLFNIACPVIFNPKPQEVANLTSFDKQSDKCDYDADAALSYYNMSVFARNALLDFSSPFRGKKILPALFWGTFDITTILFSGVPAPFPGSGGIEKTAFDEKFVEFGFWPGDTQTEDPSFFVLPYPFLQQDLSDKEVSPAAAYYSPEKKEYFLPLKHVLNKKNPHKTVVDFCKDSFRVISETQDWECMEWFNMPLLNA